MAADQTNDLNYNCSSGTRSAGPPFHRASSTVQCGVIDCLTA